MFLLTLVSFLSVPAHAQQDVFHPLDALTGREIALAVEIVQEKLKFPDTTVYNLVTLEAPPKETVWAWSEKDPLPTRQALIVSRSNGRTFETIIDLESKEILNHELMDTAGDSITFQEWDNARKSALSDPDFQGALKKHGLLNLQEADCTPVSPGIYAGEDFAERRVFRVICLTTRGSAYPAGLLIPGLHAVVDADTSKVLKIVDTSDVFLPSLSELEKVQPSPGRDPQPLNSVVQYTPKGLDVKVTGALNVSWYRWSFHLRMDRRMGPVIELLRFDDGEKLRKVAYQIAMTDIFVPYMDPDPQWHFRAFLDASEFGIGYLNSPLVPNYDCPKQSYRINAVINYDNGEPMPLPDAVCIFERSTTGVQFRHASRRPGMSSILPGKELVVRSAVTFGNYDYIFDFVFTLNGSVKLSVDAAGILATKVVESTSIEGLQKSDQAPYGMMVSPHVVAPYHDHYFTFRLDMDVDGTSNSLMRDFLVLDDNCTGDTPEYPRALFKLVSGLVTKEQGLANAGDHGNIVRIVNKDVKNHMGYETGFAIHSNDMMENIVAMKDEVQRRGGFSAYPVWVSRYHKDEVYGAGRYPLFTSKRTGLPLYVEDKESIEQEDLVLWATVGFHHIPRAEDWPYMSNMHLSAELKPFNFLNMDPSNNVTYTDLPTLKGDIPVEPNQSVRDRATY